MKILVTGAAGFIGSHLCEILSDNGQYEVIGLDAFRQTDIRNLQQRNLSLLIGKKNFQFIHGNLLQLDLKTLLRDTDAVYHLAGVPGVRTSWGTDFKDYVSNNILATQHLLEAARDLSIKKFIYVSTSSVYGEKVGKVSESDVPTPLSPYGVSKLSGEYLAKVYQTSYDLPLVILRYFTVYGPRQRPDMAFHRFIRNMIRNKPISIYGDGMQTRDFTYVRDCVKATAAVIDSEDSIGRTINIGGKERASVLDVIALLEEIIGKKAMIEFAESPRGEPKHTWADITLAQHLLNYEPKVPLKIGLREQFEDLQSLYSICLRSRLSSGKLLGGKCP